MPFTPATKKQTFAIFCATKVDCRSLNLSKEQASECISAIKAQNPLPDYLTKFIEAHATKECQTVRRQITDFQAIHDAAHGAGLVAATKAVLSPFAVVDAFTGDVVGHAPDVCGFAWIHFAAKAGENKAFAKWAKEKGIARAAYGGGFDINVSMFGQSMTRKEAYATAYANVLRENGIEAYPRSRMD